MKSVTSFWETKSRTCCMGALDDLAGGDIDLNLSRSRCFFLFDLWRFISWLGTCIWKFWTVSVDSSFWAPRPVFGKEVCDNSACIISAYIELNNHGSMRWRDTHDERTELNTFRSKLWDYQFVSECRPWIFILHREDLECWNDNMMFSWRKPHAEMKYTWTTKTGSKEAALLLHAFRWGELTLLGLWKGSKWSRTLRR